MRVADVFRPELAAGGVIAVLSLSGTSAPAQSSPTEAVTSLSPVASRLRGSPTLSGKPPGVPQGRRAQVGRQRQSPYFDRWGIELSVGAEALEGLPGTVSTEGLFLSAGLYLSRFLAVIAETGTTGWATGRLTAPGQAPQKFVDAPRSWPSKPAACPEIRAYFGTYMGGVQYRHRFRGSTPFVRVLAGRTSYSGTATEMGASGVRTSCYDAFGSGRAVAAGGGMDMHLTDRFVIRFMADYRRLVVPSLEGMETVFMVHDPDAHLDMVRVAVGFVLGL